MKAVGDPGGSTWAAGPAVVCHAEPPVRVTQALCRPLPGRGRNPKNPKALLKGIPNQGARKAMTHESKAPANFPPLSRAKRAAKRLSPKSGWVSQPLSRVSLRCNSWGIG